MVLMTERKMEADERERKMRKMVLMKERKMVL